MGSKKTMKINFILPSGGLSGGPLAIMEYANRLIDRGHTVTITTYPSALWPKEWKKNERPFPWFSFKGDFVYVKCSRLEWKKQCLCLKSFLDIGGSREIKQSMGFENMMRDQLIISALIGCMPDCDINIATLWSTAYAAFLSKKGKPVYFMQHYEEVFFPIDDSMVLNRLGARMSYQLPIYKIANSSWLQDLIYKKCGQLVPFSNNAIDLKDFEPKPKLSEKDGIIRILTFSRPEEWKGFADTAAAMAKIHFEYGDRVEWHVFGKEHDFIKPNNADTPYVLHTKLPFSELARLYAECDIAVCGSWYESFPLPPLEAMASGTAVVTTLNGMEDYCFDNKNCLVVKTRNIDDFEKAILRLIEDKKLRERLVQEGLKTASEYDWDTAVERREKMLLDICNGKVKYDIVVPLEIGLTDDENVPFEEMPKDLQVKIKEKSKISYGGMIFLIENHRKRHITTPEILAALSTPGEKTIDVDALTFSRIPRGLPIRSLNEI